MAPARQREIGRIRGRTIVIVGAADGIDAWTRHNVDTLYDVRAWMEREKDARPA